MRTSQVQLWHCMAVLDISGGLSLVLVKLSVFSMIDSLWVPLTDLWAHLVSDWMVTGEVSLWLGNNPIAVKMGRVRSSAAAPRSHVACIRHRSSASLGSQMVLSDERETRHPHSLWEQPACPGCVGDWRSFTVPPSTAGFPLMLRYLRLVMVGVISESRSKAVPSSQQ